MHIANLTDPIFKDMYWQTYKLTPLVADEQLLSKLYDDTTWLRREISFIGDHSKLIYHFCLSSKTHLSDKPDKVLLRGPYLQNNPIEPISIIQ